MENLEQPKEVGSENFGKFKDADSLLKAYNNLEAEFTKKSQKLALLEDEKQKNEQNLNFQAEIEAKVENFVTKYECFKPFKSALKESLKNADTNLEEQALHLISNSYKTADDYVKNDEFLTNYIYNNQSIKEKIVKDYLSKIAQNTPIKTEFGSGNISLTPPYMPTTIKEAGKMAKSIIKQK